MLIYHTLSIRNHRGWNHVIFQYMGRMLYYIKCKSYLWAKILQKILTMIIFNNKKVFLQRSVTKKVHNLWI